jgi:hypothetical protein
MCTPHLLPRIANPCEAYGYRRPGHLSTGPTPLTNVHRYSQAP